MTILLGFGANSHSSSHRQEDPKGFDQWRVIPILSHTESGDINCTATLFHFKSRCALVTNYHCVPGLAVPEVTTVPSDDSDESLVNSLEGLLSGTVYQNTDAVALKVLKRNSDDDLAELEMPKILKLTCESALTQLEPLPTSEVLQKYAKASLATEGFVNSGFHRTYSEYRSWINPQMADGFSEITRYQRTPKADDLFFEVSNLKIIPGMSGGVTYDQRWNPIGLNSQLIPFQDVAYLVPLNRIENFLTHGTNFVDPRSSVKAGYHLTNGSLLSGGNTHAGGGGNTHAGGGGNTHAGGGDVNGIQGQYPLSDFEEPDEGVPMEESSTKILLGVNGMQIDGMNDFANRYDPVKGQSPKLIMRDENGYPDEAVRKNIFARLAGIFMADHTHDIFYIASTKNPEGWQHLDAGDSKTLIYIDPKQKFISIHTDPHRLFNPLNPAADLNAAEDMWIFSGSFSPDFKTVFLTNLKDPKAVFECDNRNYLKLICEWSGFQLSFSAENETEVSKPSTLAFRFLTLWKDGQGHALSDFRFGKVKGSKLP